MTQRTNQVGHTNEPAGTPFLHLDLQKTALNVLKRTPQACEQSDFLYSMSLTVCSANTTEAVNFFIEQKF